MHYKYRCKQLLFIVSFFAAILVGCSLLTVFVYDPLQLQEYDHYDANKFLERPNMRLQLNGIVQNVDFDSIILGTSILQHTSALEASELLDGSFVNISLPEANFYERALILNYVLKNKNIKNIIYSFDSSYFTLLKNSTQVDNWEFLYDNDPFNDLNVVFSATYIRPTIKHIIKHLDTPYIPKKINIDFFDAPNRWITESNKDTYFGGLQSWINNMDSLGLRNFFTLTIQDHNKNIKISKADAYEDVNIAEQIDYVNAYILKFVKENPHTNFYIILPPYYRYNYASWRQVGGHDYFLYQKISKYMVNEAEKYKNLFIYGFEDQEFIDDIKNFMDLLHFSPEINSLITKSIAAGKHRLTNDNIDAYLEKSEKLALEYDMQKFYDEAQRLLQEKR